eukprot:1158040-Pelagomonas_calceolata.AAC.1
MALVIKGDFPRSIEILVVPKRKKKAALRSEVEGRKKEQHAILVPRPKHMPGLKSLFPRRPAVNRKLTEAKTKDTLHGMEGCRALFVASFIEHG